MKSYPLLTIDKQYSSIILADGDYPTHSLSLALLSKSDYVVCCDGATDAFVDKGGVPKAIVAMVIHYPKPIKPALHIVYTK